MKAVLPTSISLAVEAFKKLPGVGQRSAERYVYALLKAEPSDGLNLATSLQDLYKNIRYCPKTFAFIEPDEAISELYDHPDRDKTTVMVVASPFDILALERLDNYHGTYHVLGGLLSPIDGIGANQLHLEELKARVAADKVKELIFAFSSSVEGESTAQLIQTNLQGIKLSRLAQGLPIGVDIEYADDLTLSRALTNRQAL